MEIALVGICKDWTARSPIDLGSRAKCILRSLSDDQNFCPASFRAVVSSWVNPDPKS